MVFHRVFGGFGECDNGTFVVNIPTECVDHFDVIVSPE